ncbi:MAG: phage holin family protein [Candidatus Moranbacteria bacterium]|jgi:putative membrane protein|nr:phage holin family protein [Candidatus Moranbacteria bacterium]
MTVLLKWVVSALAFLVLPYIVPGISVKGFGTALLLAFLWGVIGITVKPILVILTLPINLLTFGIFTFIINGALLFMLGGFIKGFEVKTFFAAILGALALSLIHMLSHWIIKSD